MAEPTGPLKLHCQRRSVSSLPVIAVVEEAGLPYEVIFVNLEKGEMMSEAFKAMNPMHCIPTLDDGGFVMWEGRAIGRYLCNKYRVPEHLYPKDPQERAMCDLSLDLHHTYSGKITMVALYPSFGWEPVPEEKELRQAEATLNAEIWPAMQLIINNSKGPLMGGLKPNLGDIFFATHIEITAMTAPDSFVARHQELRAYARAVKEACGKWDAFMGGDVAAFFEPAAAAEYKKNFVMPV